MHTKLYWPHKFNNNTVRNWTLYIIRFTNGHYYVGITSYKDFMHRINQHGGPRGARVNRGKVVEEIIEIRHLGRMSADQASRIENDTTLECRKVFGALKVKGGHDIFEGTSLIPSYTPGSLQSFIFIIATLLLAGVLLVTIILIQRG